MLSYEEPLLLCNFCESVSYSDYFSFGQSRQLPHQILTETSIVSTPYRTTSLINKCTTNSSHERPHLSPDSSCAFRSTSTMYPIVFGAIREGEGDMVLALEGFSWLTLLGLPIRWNGRDGVHFSPSNQVNQVGFGFLFHVGYPTWTAMGEIR